MTSPLDRIDVEGLKAAAEKATPGERVLLPASFSPRIYVMRADYGADNAAIADVRDRYDAAFIAAANPSAILSLIARTEAAEGEVERLKHQVSGYRHHLRESEQIAGKALGYPWFKDDQAIFPGATDADGVCIGDHVGDTIVAELATRFTELIAQRAALVATLRQARNQVVAFAIDSVGAAAGVQSVEYIDALLSTIQATGGGE